MAATIDSTTEHITRVEDLAFGSETLGGSSTTVVQLVHRNISIPTIRPKSAFVPVVQGSRLNRIVFVLPHDPI